MLRDVEGWEPEEVYAALDLTDGNQRVLLHRARSKVRDELERYFDGSRDRPDHSRRDQLPEVVELVTDYLDGALRPRTSRGSRRT